MCYITLSYGGGLCTDDQKQLYDLKFCVPCGGAVRADATSQHRYNEEHNEA